MYTRRLYSAHVRDGSSRYGDLPFPPEEQGAAGALRDLRRATDEDVPRILARYAVLRAFSLRSLVAPDSVVAHAVSAAMAHLDATRDGWAENDLLRRAWPVCRERPVVSLLLAAASAAEGSGHHHGARALREIVQRENWIATRCVPPSPS